MRTNRRAYSRRGTEEEAGSIERRRFKERRQVGANRSAHARPSLFSLLLIPPFSPALYTARMCRRRAARLADKMKFILPPCPPRSPIKIHLIPRFTISKFSSDFPARFPKKPRRLYLFRLINYRFINGGEDLASQEASLASLGIGIPSRCSRFRHSFFPTIERNARGGWARSHVRLLFPRIFSPPRNRYAPMIDERIPSPPVSRWNRRRSELDASKGG